MERPPQVFITDQAPVEELHKTHQWDLAELPRCFSTEAETKLILEELEGQEAKLLETLAENSQLRQRIQSMEVLLEAGQLRRLREDEGWEAAN